MCRTRVPRVDETRTPARILPPRRDRTVHFELPELASGNVGAEVDELCSKGRQPLVGRIFRFGWNNLGDRCLPPQDSIQTGEMSGRFNDPTNLAKVSPSGTVSSR